MCGRMRALAILILLFTALAIAGHATADKQGTTLVCVDLDDGSVHVGAPCTICTLQCFSPKRFIQDAWEFVRGQIPPGPPTLP